MDLEMPVMGGIEAAQRIRALQRESGEPPSLIAAFSAHDDEPTRRKLPGGGLRPLPGQAGLARGGACRAARAGPGSRRRSAGVDDSLPGIGGTVWVESGLMPLMPEFLASRRQLAEELAQAVAQGERETVRVTAHKLAGSLAMYGFKDASRASRALEEAAGGEEFAQLRRRCDALAQMIAQARPVARPA